MSSGIRETNDLRIEEGVQKTRSRFGNERCWITLWGRGGGGFIRSPNTAIRGLTPNINDLRIYSTYNHAKQVRIF